MMQNNENFEVVLSTKAKAKNGASTIYIETSTKGLIYRSEVYMDEHMIDAVEMNCSDISSVDRYEDIFQARYAAAHQKLEDLYTQERIFARVLTTDGDYAEGPGSLSVITSTSDNVFKCEAFLDSSSIDVRKEEVEGDDPAVFKAKYTQVHKEFVKNYIKVLKFPANTFINPVIKRFPLYAKSPMYAFILFLLTVMLILWILSLVVCGKAMKKIVTKVAGKEAGMIVKDLQKGMCSKKGGGNEKTVVGKDGSTVVMSTDEDGKTTIKHDIKKKLPNFVVLPQNITFKNTNQIYPVYIKNNKKADILVRLKDRVIFDFEDALVSPDMVVNVITKEALHIDSNKVGQFEFKIEKAFLESESLEERLYKGAVILDATDLQTRENETITISFEFSVQKDEDIQAEQIAEQAQESE